jgi:hypothetical protein
MPGVVEHEEEDHEPVEAAVAAQAIERRDEARQVGREGQRRCEGQRRGVEEQRRR